MSKFHSTVSRRDFMKGLGLTGVGLGSASLGAPVLHDLDEAMSKDDSKSAAQGNKPWWAEERPYMNITTELDWDVIQAFRTDLYNNSDAHWSSETYAQILQTKSEIDGRLYTDSVKYPGFGRRGAALLHSCLPDSVEALQKYPDGSTHNSFTGDCDLVNGVYKDVLSGFLAPLTEEWNGTPEENARMIRTMCRYFGGYDVRFLAVDEKLKKILNTHMCDDLVNFTSKVRKYVFRDVDKPYVTDTEAVIPNKFKYAIILATGDTHSTLSLPMSAQEAASIAMFHGCFRANYPQLGIQRFLGNLGFSSVGGSARRGLGQHVAAAVCSGFGELGRMQQVMQAGFSGADWIGTTRIILTDLPLPTSNPIDAGMAKFCETCLKCANVCPSGAIQKTPEPTWDISSDSSNPDLKPMLFNNPGKKSWYYNHARCARWMNEHAGFCGLCSASCVFNKQPYSSVHEVILGVVGNTSIFNSFFTKMDGAFGYGKYEVNVETRAGDDFWDLEYDMPIWGVDRSADK